MAKKKRLPEAEEAATGPAPNSASAFTNTDGWAIKCSGSMYRLSSTPSDCTSAKANGASGRSFAQASKAEREAVLKEPDKPFRLRIACRAARVA